MKLLEKLGNPAHKEIVHTSISVWRLRLGGIVRIPWDWACSVLQDAFLADGAREFTHALAWALLFDSPHSFTLLRPFVRFDNVDTRITGRHMAKATVSYCDL